MIELMMVVAIIGIIATIAIPSYARYVTRTRVYELYKRGISIEPVISGEMIDGASVADINYASGAADFTSISASDTITSSVTITAGIITVTSTGDVVDSTGAPFVLFFTPTCPGNNRIIWSCTTSNAASEFDFLPRACQITGAGEVPVTDVCP